MKADQASENKILLRFQAKYRPASKTFTAARKHPACISRAVEISVTPEQKSCGWGFTISAIGL
jgi:hypothetical protein